MRKELLRLHQARLAQLAIGPSTARGQGAGVVERSRQWLAEFDLGSLPSRSPGRFPEVLDAATEKFRRSLPRGTQSWGAARKFLNIFLRDALYNRYLCQHHALAALENQLEVPLDSHVGKGLRFEREGVHLPRWSTIKGLRPADSSAYQAVASRVAARLGFARVHLDLEYWRRDRVA